MDEILLLPLGALFGFWFQFRVELKLLLPGYLERRVVLLRDLELRPKLREKEA